MPYVSARSSVSMTEYLLSASFSDMLPHWTNRHVPSPAFCIRLHPHPLMVDPSVYRCVSKFLSNADKRVLSEMACLIRSKSLQCTSGIHVKAVLRFSNLR